MAVTRVGFRASASSQRLQKSKPIAANYFSIRGGSRKAIAKKRVPIAQARIKI
jgi:hypothetical protein